MKSFSELVENFLNSFQILSKKFRQIFKYMQYMCKSKRTVWPSLRHISKTCECSVKTVQRALSYFNSQGWLVWRRCPYQSNLYFMDDGLLALNMNNKKTFEKTNVHQNVHQNVHVSSHPCSSSSMYGTKQDVPVPQIIKIKGLTPEEMQELANQYTERELACAIEDLKWYERKGNKIREFFKCLRSQAWKVSKGFV